MLFKKLHSEKCGEYLASKRRHREDTFLWYKGDSVGYLYY